MEDEARLTRNATMRAPRPRTAAFRAAALSAALAAACHEPPAPRGRYTLASVDDRPVPIAASFYTPAVGYRADLVGGDLLICSPTLAVWTDRVREQNETVPTDDPRAHPHESWHTEPAALRRDGRRLFFTPADAPPPRTDTGTLAGPDGDTITVDQHTHRPGAPTRRYRFVRTPADTADQGHAGTLCGNYMTPAR